MAEMTNAQVALMAAAQSTVAGQFNTTKYVKARAEEYLEWLEENS